MNRLRWYLLRSLERIPVITLMAWAALIALVWVTVFLLLPSQHQLNTAKKNEPVAAMVRVVKPPASATENFLQGVPEVRQVAEAIHTIFRLADNHRIKIEEIVYRDEIKSGEPVLRYVIDFSVQDRYPRIKAFLSGLLAAMPYLALQQISFEREHISDDQVQVNLKFNLFLGHE
jgi:hypothetical protein